MENLVQGFLKPQAVMPFGAAQGNRTDTPQTLAGIGPRTLSPKKSISRDHYFWLDFPLSAPHIAVSF